MLLCRVWGLGLHPEQQGCTGARTALPVIKNILEADRAENSGAGATGIRWTSYSGVAMVCEMGDDDLI